MVSDCSSSLSAVPDYIKALARRAAAYEHLDRLEEALADHQKVLQLDPVNRESKEKVRGGTGLVLDPGRPHAHPFLQVSQLGPVVEQRREKLKDEMLGKLKDLGNSLLGRFGLSLDNFKATKDPSTGSYSISFQQNS